MSAAVHTGTTTRSHHAVALVVLGVVFVVVAWGSATLGRYDVPLATWWKLILAPEDTGIAGQILLQVRLPRIAAGILIGAASSSIPSSLPNLR